MTRTRKLTLTVKEFSHLVSESLDIANATTPPSLVDHTAVFSESPQKTNPRQSSFQRIFSRPTPAPGQREDGPDGSPEELSEAPRKTIGWPFSRSPRKARPTKDEDARHGDDDPEFVSHACSVASLATASTSSLGSIIPVHERLFQVTSHDSDKPNQTCKGPKSKAVIVLPRAEPAGSPSDAIFGDSRSGASIVANSTIEPVAGSSHRRSASSDSTEASRDVAGSFEEDPTPRASTFGSRVALPSAGVRDSASAQRGRPHGLSLVVPSRDVEILTLRPAVGVTPHAPSETVSSISLCSMSSPTSPGPSPTFPATKQSESEDPSQALHPAPPNVRISALFPGAASPSNMEPASPLGLSPRQRKGAMSRSLTPPPLPLPPPTGPLPAVPSSIPPVPPVPPLPSLLSKLSMNTSPHSTVSSPPRPTIAGVSTNPATALPPSPPGGLRLPSRLSWVNSVRAVLPSPPASPTKSFKSLAGKQSPHSPSKAETKPPASALKRPTSIGVIEAADDAQVRRTKSILLLGARSKSNVSLGIKRVQIHADANLEANPSHKPRRKSSAATVPAPMDAPVPSSELLVLRERRHSAPVLASADTKVPGASADWTLSLPFCTDVPGEKIQPSPSLAPQGESEHGLEEMHDEDWTLCMPLKVRVGTPTEPAERADSEYTQTETTETGETRTTMQLPTPSPSPTWPSPTTAASPLDPEESETEPEERPPSRESLGPHTGGLDLAGGRGKRASGWHVYGWFDEVDVPEDERDAVSPTPTVVSEYKLTKNHISVFRKTHDAAGRHPSQDSMSTVSTSGTTFYSARSSLLVN